MAPPVEHGIAIRTAPLTRGNLSDRHLFHARDHGVGAFDNAPSPKGVDYRNARCRLLVEQLVVQ